MFPENQLSFQSLVKIIALALGLTCVLLYIAFQARFLLIGPQITLLDEPNQLQNERQITLTGTAFNISRLWLNDRPIYTDAQGNFKEAFMLENGYTITTVRAEDRYGRETTIKRTYVYTPASFNHLIN